MTGHSRCDTDAALTLAAADAVSALLHDAAVRDGFDALNESARLLLRHPAPDTVHVLAWADDVLVGYAQLQSGPDVPGPGAMVFEAAVPEAVNPEAVNPGAVTPESTGSLVVAPDARRTGVGTTLLRALRTASAGRTLTIWAPHDTAAAAALAARQHLTPVRELMMMKRSLTDPVEAPELAPGVTVRTFDPAMDGPSWLRVNARAFAQHPEQGGLTAADLAEREAEDWFDPDGFFLAVRDTDETLLGYHWTKEHGGGVGEVYVLGVDPDCAGQGLGKALLRTGLRHLADGGDTAVLLYVEADHPSAIRLYASHGFVESSRDVLYASAKATPNSDRGSD